MPLRLRRFIVRLYDPMIGYAAHVLRVITDDDFHRLVLHGAIMATRWTDGF